MRAAFGDNMQRYTKTTVIYNIDSSTSGRINVGSDGRASYCSPGYIISHNIAIKRLNEWNYPDTAKVSSTIKFSCHELDVGDISNDDLQAEITD